MTTATTSRVSNARTLPFGKPSGGLLLLGSISEVCLRSSVPILGLLSYGFVVYLGRNPPADCISTGPAERRGPRQFRFRPIIGTHVASELDSQRHGRCCRDQAMLDAAYEQYVNDPKAPWNRTARNR